MSPEMASVQRPQVCEECAAAFEAGERERRSNYTSAKVTVEVRKVKSADQARGHADRPTSRVDLSCRSPRVAPGCAGK